MKKLTDKVLKFLRGIAGTEGVQPLTAENAQSLSYYRKNKSYDEMVETFHKHVFSQIRCYSSGMNDYVVIDVPVWLKQDSYEKIKKNLLDFNFCIREIPEINLLVIYWNSRE